MAAVLEGVLGDALETVQQYLKGFLARTPADEPLEDLVQVAAVAMVGAREKIEAGIKPVAFAVRVGKCAALHVIRTSVRRRRRIRAVPDEALDAVAPVGEAEAPVPLRLTVAEALKSFGPDEHGILREYLDPTSESWHRAALAGRPVPNAQDVAAVLAVVPPSEVDRQRLRFRQCLEAAGVQPRRVLHRRFGQKEATA